jgi:hypothetical protein
MESTLVVTIAEIRPALIPFWTMKPTYVAAGYKGRKWDFLAVPEFAPYVGFLLRGRHSADRLFAGSGYREGGSLSEDPSAGSHGIASVKLRYQSRGL